MNTTRFWAFRHLVLPCRLKIIIMQKILTLLLFASLLFVSCRGEQGFPGKDGEDGEDGVNILGQVFKVELDFIKENQYTNVLIPYPSNIEVYDGDVVMVYVLDGVDGELDIWEPLPRTLYFSDGILLYGFNYTLVDVELFLDGTLDLNSLASELTQNLIFRLAILPSVLPNNIESVMSAVDSEIVLK
jgi:hypothetical protein